MTTHWDVTSLCEQLAKLNPGGKFFWNDTCNCIHTDFHPLTSIICPGGVRIQNITEEGHSAEIVKYNANGKKYGSYELRRYGLYAPPQH